MSFQAGILMNKLLFNINKKIKERQNKIKKKMSTQMIAQYRNILNMPRSTKALKYKPQIKKK